MNKSRSHSLQTGTVLNEKWVILEFLGKGAMGEVYRAHQLILKRDTAIKVVSPEWLESCEDDEEEIKATFQRFKREVEAMAAIRHPNVLQILDYDSTTVRKGDKNIAVDYIAMEYVPGNTLRSTMLEEGFYPDEDATKNWLVNYFAPMLLGVKAIHDAGIVHRDLKPDNVLLDGNTPKIADFGLARSHRLKSVTQSADSKGTPPYMAPEQFLDFKRTGKRADIYSLGKILYEAIEGKMTQKTMLPFQCARLKETNTPFFEKLDQLVCDTTAENKNDRVKSVELFHKAIEGAIAQLSAEKISGAGDSFRGKTTTVFCANFQGAGFLTKKDGSATWDILTQYKELTSRIIQDHRGRISKVTGNSFLAEFGSAVDAVQSAVTIQDALHATCPDTQSKYKTSLRIGIHLGDIVEDNGQMRGEGFDVATGIRSLAVEGGILCSHAVYEQVRNSLLLVYKDLGQHTFKNLPEPVRVYGVEPSLERVSGKMIGPALKRGYFVSRALGIAGLLIIIALAVSLWKKYQEDPSPPLDKLSIQKMMTLSPADQLPTAAFPEKTSVRGSEPVLPPPEPGGYHSLAYSDPAGDMQGGPSGDGETVYEQDPFPDIETDLPSIEGKKLPSPEALEMRKGKMQDKSGGVPESILKLQILARVNPPSIEYATAQALRTAEKTAEPLIDRDFHNGKKRVVPDQFKNIQSAIDASKRGDWVVVKAGRYFESIVLKAGVKLVSDSSGGGDKMEPVEGGQLYLPVRTLRTIIDGSKAKGSAYWVISFEEGAERTTIVDGFTIEHLPVQDHHILSSSYAVNVLGASPVIMHCYIRKNGSMGIGNHVLYERSEIRVLKPKNHFKATDVKNKAEPIIYRNVICQNLGLGIRCDHFSAPFLLGNELFLNVFPYRAEYGEKASPGIEATHGSVPKIVGNIVHNHPGAGIFFDACMPEELGEDKSRSLPNIVNNVVYSNGANGLSILCSGQGASMPIRCVGNLVCEAGWIGIDLSKNVVCIVEDNIVYKAGAPGIRVDGASVLRLNRNKVTGANGPGFIIKNGGHVREMVANVSDLNKGPRFVLRKGRIADLDG